MFNHTKNEQQAEKRFPTYVDTPIYWDTFGQDYVLQKVSVNPLCTQYIKHFYNQFLTLALGRLDLNSDMRILKVDLWNEGIETSRDILGQFKNYDTVGFDLSWTVCRHAKKRLSNAGIVHATCKSLPFASGNFDLVLDLSTIDHIPFSEATGVLSEYYRVLKPGGLLALAFWQSNIATKYVKHIDPDQLFFNSKKVANSLKNIGFEIVDSYNTGALLTFIDCNLWLGQFLFWRLKTVFEDRLFISAAKVEPYLLNLLGGLHIFYAYHP